jgi:hypothetical protein
VCQLAAVSAFVPRECCAAHRQAAVPAASHGGHDGHSSHHAHHPAHDDRSCAMRGVCNGPTDALATLFMAPGLPLRPFTLLAESAARPGLRPAPANALDALRLPTTPPPRV